MLQYRRPWQLEGPSYKAWYLVIACMGSTSVCVPMSSSDNIRHLFFKIKKCAYALPLSTRKTCSPFSTSVELALNDSTLFHWDLYWLHTISTQERQARANDLRFVEQILHDARWAPFRERIDHTCSLWARLSILDSVSSNLVPISKGIRGFTVVEPLRPVHLG